MDSAMDSAYDPVAPRRFSDSCGNLEWDCLENRAIGRLFVQVHQDAIARHCQKARQCWAWDAGPGLPLPS